MSRLDYEKLSFMQEGLFASSMTGHPFSALPHDQWIEMTMNKGSKMKGGWIGITQNENVLHINTKIVNKVIKLKEVLKQMAGFGDYSMKHIECTNARKENDERAVQNLISTIQLWQSNPWTSEALPLRTLESGLVASQKLEADFKTAKQDVENRMQEYLKESIQSNKKQFVVTLS